MSGCCTPRGYRRMFSDRLAAASARRYRRRGLDRTSRRIVQFLMKSGVAGRTVLEVGGGIGDTQIELLRAGASRAVSVELTPTYERVATSLLRDLDLAGRVERRVADFTAIQADLPPADIVLLNRVVCCYPDMPTLARAAGEHTRGVLVMSFPKATWWTRAILSSGNAALRIARREFQVFLHQPAEIRRTVELHGLRQVLDRRGVFWQIVAFEAPGARG